MKKSKVILISGDSSGFGLECSKKLIEEGYIVCGLSRHQFKLNGLNHYICDLTKEDEVRQTIEQIISKYNKIDVLINNAGWGIFGSIEETSLEQAKRIFDINFFGTFLLTKYVLPYMRSNNYGRIITISSIGGVIPLPFQSFYSASKSSLEMLFRALQSEIYTYNIKITLVQPGDARTNFTSNRYSNISETSPYKDALNKSIKTISKDERSGFSPTKVSNTINKLIKRKRPPFVVRVGTKDSLLLTIYKIIPKKFATYLLYKIYASK